MLSKVLALLRMVAVFPVPKCVLLLKVNLHVNAYGKKTTAEL